MAEHEADTVSSCSNCAFCATGNVGPVAAVQHAVGNAAVLLQYHFRFDHAHYKKAQTISIPVNKELWEMLKSKLEGSKVIFMDAIVANGLDQIIYEAEDALQPNTTMSFNEQALLIYTLVNLD